MSRDGKLKYIQMDCNISSHPEHRVAGFWGTTVFRELVLVSGEFGLRGRIPPKYANPEWIADRLGRGAHAEAVREGIASAVRAGLLLQDGQDLVIPDWYRWCGGHTAYQAKSRGTTDRPADPPRNTQGTRNVTHIPSAGIGGPRGTSSTKTPSGNVSHKERGAEPSGTAQERAPSDPEQLALITECESPTGDKNRLEQVEVGTSTCRVCPEDEQAVFDHWKQATGHERAQFTSERRRVVRKALDEMGYSVADCCLAIDGCLKTPYNMGENETGVLFNDLGLVIRDAAHIDRFCWNALHPPKAAGRRLSEAEKRRLEQDKIELEVLKRATERAATEAG